MKEDKILEEMEFYQKLMESQPFEVMIQSLVDFVVHMEYDTIKAHPGEMAFIVFRQDFPGSEQQCEIKIGAVWCPNCEEIHTHHESTLVI